MDLAFFEKVVVEGPRQEGCECDIPKEMTHYKNINNAVNEEIN